MTLKRRIVYCLLLASFCLAPDLIYGQQGNPAPCQEVTLINLAVDSVKRKLLRDYIGECLRAKEFTNDKGILHLYQYQNGKNNLCWVIFPSIEDAYKDNPPMQFSDFEGDIVLVYEADSTSMTPKSATGDVKAINACLEQIIGDRVYIRPTIKTRWTNEVLPYTNRKRSQGSRRVRTGGGFAILVEFLPNNTYTISRFG